MSRSSEPCFKKMVPKNSYDIIHGHIEDEGIEHTPAVCDGLIPIPSVSCETGGG